ncbi:MAG: hypothetical protein HRT45_08005 [Bdellovibrionales bacterium]|nr:hypothetical protein [Bdellovibrionales bacterium]
MKYAAIVTLGVLLVGLLQADWRRQVVSAAQLEQEQAIDDQNVQWSTSVTDDPSVAQPSELDQQTQEELREVDITFDEIQLAELNKEFSEVTRDEEQSFDTPEAYDHHLPTADEEFGFHSIDREVAEEMGFDVRNLYLESEEEVEVGAAEDDQAESGEEGDFEPIDESSLDDNGAA